MAAAESKFKNSAKGEKDNPWEVAAVNDSFSKSSLVLNNSSMDTTRSHTDDVGHHHRHRQQPRRPVVPEQQRQSMATAWTREYDATAAAERAEECAHSTRRIVVRFCLFLDWMVAFGGTVYALVLYTTESSQSQRPIAAIALVILLVALLYIRCISAAFLQQCCWFIAVHVSAVLAMIYLVASMVTGITLNWIHPHLLETYLRQHDNLLLPLDVSNFLQIQSGKLWMGLLILFAAECAQWQLLQTYRRSLFFDPDEDNNYDVDDDGRIRIHGDAPLRESLLRGSSSSRRTRRNHQQSGMEKQWWQWDTWTIRRRRQRDDSPNPRDNEDNLLFAAVQEEWASRTEEDPFWWSRDEEEIAPELKPTSWVEDQPQQPAGGGPKP